MFPCENDLIDESSDDSESADDDFDGNEDDSESADDDFDVNEDDSEDAEESDQELHDDRPGSEEKAQPVKHPGVDYIGRVVTISVAAMYRRVIDQRELFGDDYKKAKIHMRIVSHKMTKCKKPLVGELVHPELYEPEADGSTYQLVFTVAEVAKMLVPRATEYVDTPQLEIFE